MPKLKKNQMRHFEQFSNIVQLLSFQIFFWLGHFKKRETEVYYVKRFMMIAKGL